MQIEFDYVFNGIYNNRAQEFCMKRKRGHGKHHRGHAKHHRAMQFTNRGGGLVRESGFEGGDPSNGITVAHLMGFTGPRMLERLVIDLRRL